MKKALLCLIFVGSCLLPACQPLSGSLSGNPSQPIAHSSVYMQLSGNTISTDISSDAAVSSDAESSAPLSSALTSSADGSSSATTTSASVSSVKKPISSATTTAPTSSKAVSSTTQAVIKPINGETKAVWISQFDLANVLKHNGKQREKSSFTALFGAMLTNLKSYGFNTIFLQARPYSDSFYPSAYFPWSSFVVSAYGDTASYDPYQIMVTQARAQGFSVHGWVNPLRGMTDAQLKQVPDTFPIKKWYNDSAKRGVNIVLKDNRWYYNASVAEVRELIANGAKELLQKYQLDGIHIDDYFYYSKSIADISKMVKALYNAVKSVNPAAQFGVAPEGNIERDYSVHLADVKTWCKEKGYIDYICPQIYYGLEHATHDFASVVAEWNNLISADSGIYLLAGMTLGKAGNPDQFAGTSGRHEWQQSNDIIKRCIIEGRKQSRLKGFSIFCYQYLFDPLTGAKTARTLAEVNNFLPELKK